MSPKVLELLTLDNDVFKSYVFWSGVLVLKMIVVMPLLTGIQRFTTHVSIIWEFLNFNFLNVAKELFFFYENSI